MRFGIHNSSWLDGPDPGRSQHPGPLGEREPPPGRLGGGDALDHPPLRRARAPAAAVTWRRSGLTSSRRRCTMARS